MPQLPTGTVTLLFSDIESSTLMVRELGDVWLPVLQQHRALCRTVWHAHHGHELGTEGDSFLVVFESAGDGVAAALAAQRALAVAHWPADARVAVRMGLHSGTPQRHAEGYVGLDVHKGARVMATAHGGQVVLSEATAALAALPAGVLLRDLGEHRLKDLPEPMRLHQLVADGLRLDFPSLRSQGAAASLPQPLTPTVGRVAELVELRALLLDDAERLVTLTGPGGTGKTRLATALAVDIAGHYPDGVFLIPLVAATTAPDLWTSILQGLDMAADGGRSTVVDHLAERRMLLVLDNLEQITDADDVVRSLLVAAPALTIVTTSRRPLHIEGEIDYAVPPLPLPSGTSLGQVRRSGSVQLFVQQAQRARKSFTLDASNAADIAALCAALDGLPLALELAAARSKLLSPRAILTRIDQSLDLASPDRAREDRQRTVRGAISWSYDLLEPDRRTALDHLGVFAGGASIDAVAQVVGHLVQGDDLDDVLFDLVDASLVRVVDDEEGEPRFHLLETVRRFALDRLTGRGELEQAVTAHAQHYYGLLQVLLDSASGRAHARVRSRFLLEIGNIQAAIERGASGVRDSRYVDAVVPPRHVVALACHTATVFRRFAEGLRWCDLAPAVLDDGNALGELSVLVHQGTYHYGLSETTAALADLGRAVGALEPLLADADVDLPVWVSPVESLAAALYRLAFAQLRIADLDAAGRTSTRLLTLSEAGGPSIRTRAIDVASVLAQDEGDLPGAYDFLVELLRLGATDVDRALYRNNLADLELQLGRRAAAQATLAAGTEETIALGDPWTVALTAETFGAAVGLAHPLLCARVYGACGVLRSVEGIPNDDVGEAEDARVIAEVRPVAGSAAFDDAFERGRSESVVDLLRELAALAPLPPD